MRWKAMLVAMLVFLPLHAASADHTTDLEMAWIRAPRSVTEGALPAVTARVDNHGSRVVRNVTVSFYLDVVSEKTLIARRRYDSVNVYRRPRVTWDTTGVTGTHTVIARAELRDASASSNVATTTVTVRRSEPGPTARQLLISEIYPHPYPRRDNEYICLHNPTGQPVNLFHWRLTTTPRRRPDEQTAVVFPNIHIDPHETMYIAQNASAFSNATGIKADYEYGDGGATSNLQEQGWFVLSNDGAALSLKDGYNYTVDSVVYGDGHPCEGWNGSPAPAPGEGTLLHRWDVSRDSNDSRDWRSRRLGASTWQPREVTFTGNVTVFAAPDTAFSVIQDVIAGASDSIYLNLYTFTSPWLCDCICQAAARNVSVTVLLEGQPVGGLSIEERWVASRIAEAGGDVRYMYGEERRRYAYDHAKYAVVDNHTAVISSANWGATGVPPAESYGNREWGIVLRNERIAWFLRRILQDDLAGRDVVSFNASNETYGAPPSMYLPPKWLPAGDYHPCCRARTITGTFACTVVTAPDNAERAICNMLDAGRQRILVEQAYSEAWWSDGCSPFLDCIKEHRRRCSDVRMLLNQNPAYTGSCKDNNATRRYLERHNVSARFLYTNRSPLVNVHTKGAVVDNATLISSINWNENAVRHNRELGVIVENSEVAAYFAKVFNHDWHLAGEEEKDTSMLRYGHGKLFAVGVVWAAAAMLLVRHWRD